MSLFGPDAGFPPLGTAPEDPAESIKIEDTKIQDAQIQHPNFLDNDVQIPTLNHPPDNNTKEEDSENDDDEPPNRFRGHPSTYRSWNADEREMYDTMAHIWINEKFSSELVQQQRETALDVTGDESFSWRSTERWHSQKIGPDIPIKRHYTLWPLKPSRVPALEENWEESKSLDQRRVLEEGNILESSKELEELLIAHGLQTARQKWESRASNSEYPTQNTNSEIRNRNDERLSAPKDAEHHVDAQDLPVFSADDDLCAHLLQRSIRAILPKLDRLLLALHASRQGHQEARSIRKRKRNSGDLSSSDESTIDEDEQRDSPILNTAPTKERESKEKQRNYVRKLEPRDWSEVLGTAALVGWDTVSLKSAAQYCSSTFGEDMAFATLREDSNISRHSINKHFACQKPSEPDDMKGQWSLETLICPHEDCLRHHEKLNSIKKLSRHIRGVHNWEPTLHKIPETRLKVGGIHVDGFMCPIPSRKGWTGARKSAKD